MSRRKTIKKLGELWFSGIRPEDNYSWEFIEEKQTINKGDRLFRLVIRQIPIKMLPVPFPPRIETPNGFLEWDGLRGIYRNVRYMTRKELEEIYG